MIFQMTPLTIGITIVACAFAALLSHMALAVFNDGVRPFLLDFYRGEITRGQMTAIAFGLSAGFVFGLGVPIAVSSGVLNPWVLFLPTDILGILSPRRWIAPILGAAWGAVVVFGLNAATTAANALPVNFLTAMQQMANPILFLFAFFPAVATALQFGRTAGAVNFILELLALLLTMKFLPSVFPGAIALAVGMLVLIVYAVQGERRAAAEARAAAAAEPGLSDSSSDIDEAMGIFSANAARLRRHIPYYAVMGVLIGVLSNTHQFAGGEATSYILQQGQIGNAAQVDFYRALGFIPLITTTAVASGAYQIVGSTLTYPVGYLAPNPIVAGIGGGILFAVEVFVLSYVARALASLRTIRDASDNIRNGINMTLELAIVFGSIAAGNAMAGGVGIALVGGLVALNDAIGRPVVRMAAGPLAVILAGILLNILFYLQLFTPPKPPGT